MGDSSSSKKWLIHMSADDWWISLPHSRHHITRQLALKGYSVLWVNPMGMRFPSLSKKTIFRKILNKLRSLIRYCRRADNGYLVLTFLFLPVFKRNWIESMNAWLIRLQIHAISVIFRIKCPLVLVTLPTFAPLIRYMKSRDGLKSIVYYYSDQYECYREIKDPAPIIAWDKMLREDADAIYCASQAIYEKIPSNLRNYKRVRVIEHQVDFDHFDAENVTPVHLNIEKPIIGYYGSLNDSNDWDMISYAAVQQPNWQFVFIGKKLIDLPYLESLPNIHFLGFIPYHQLPKAAANFDVGLMFWKMTNWIRACSPIKFKEYLALGLPVVSVPIDEVVKKYVDYVDIAVDGPSLVLAIRSALKRSDSSQRRQFASKFSWKSVTDLICNDFDNQQRYFN